MRGLVALLNTRGTKVEKTPNGYDFPKLAMSTYNNDLQTEEAAVECLGIGLLE